MTEDQKRFHAIHQATELLIDGITYESLDEEEVVRTLYRIRNSCSEALGGKVIREVGALG